MFPRFSRVVQSLNLAAPRDIMTQREWMCTTIARAHRLRHRFSRKCRVERWPLLHLSHSLGGDRSREFVGGFAVRRDMLPLWQGDEKLPVIV
jgi:hypothetical protein